MHCLQYRFYAGSEKVDHVILLTPDEGLTKQHLQELVLSGIEAYQISDDMSLFQQGGNAVGVIDAGKVISDESHRKKGEKSFMAEEFSGKNLVLVDEGHNGSSSVQGERRRVREQLCADGFSFEYSATFGQAVAKRSGKDGVELRNHYARNILFDYSYKYFYDDKVGIPPEYKFQIENTAWTDLLIQTHAKAEWEAKNVFFLEDGGTSYLLKLFTAAKVE